MSTKPHRHSREVLGEFTSKEMEQMDAVDNEIEELIQGILPTKVQLAYLKLGGHDIAIIADVRDTIIDAVAEKLGLTDEGKEQLEFEVYPYRVEEEPEPELSEAEKLARDMVGDERDPNRYFVTASAGFHSTRGEQEREGGTSWAEDSFTDIPKKHVTYGPFNTYAEAKKRALKIALPSPEAKWDAYHSVTIEDRLSGELFNRAWVETYHPHERFPRSTFALSTYEDVGFTRDQMRARGETFK